MTENRHTKAQLHRVFKNPSEIKPYKSVNIPAKNGAFMHDLGTKIQLASDTHLLTLLCEIQKRGPDPTQSVCNK